MTDLSSHCLCDKCSGDDCQEVEPIDPDKIRQDEREKVLDELDEIAKKGMKGKEDSLGEKYCKEHPKQVNSCWHGLHRLIQKFRQEGKQEQP